jgi:hypothetical protein
MKAAVDAVERTPNHIRIGDIGLNELGLRGNVVATAARQVVEYADLMPIVEQGLDEM